MIDIINVTKENKQSYIKILKDRSQSVKKEVLVAVDEIIKDVRENGDKAVNKYTNQFDCRYINSQNIKVTEEEIKKAYALVDKNFIEAIKKAKENIFFYHEKQKRNSWIVTKEDGVILGQQIRPLDSVGIYVPGGTAAYPSSVMMNTIPAKVAGVKKIVMVTPPLKDGSINPNILVAAKVAGVDEIYKVGGAQGVAALAFGTESIGKVDKIVGPGNIYVAMAKRSVYGYVDIDMIAGPSEILVIADEDNDPKFIAADLMSQAEHDELASSTLVTTSNDLAIKVKEELQKQIRKLSRKSIIEKSLKNYGAILVVENLKEAIDMANVVAPEHLEVLVKEPFSMLGEIKNAGSIFLGKFAPEPLGDYMAGPNHVLPTNGSAKFFSPLSVDDYIKKSSYLYYSENALKKVKDDIVTIAKTEGLTAHANSIEVRFK
ncbi:MULTISPECIES: histidinol dehydrogenase [Clostridium]|uniref:Histidinol dehydrogenase n=1 Tax=Clostridium novyi (strain NT) TaxID=386415 RepID=A0PXP4_CLONN|nr:MULTISPECIES: histidinol dehydrogenase [Clostridium]ABK60551.1 histidinol dehydrogenase [Clostridium novyi NT]KEH84914.1 histidinol dehydrogenase [Clostridium novyi A str. NCTC 538]KEH85122.1 histidinol dehydrogenase [Clostridium novyi A str. 4540]KEH91387.1 histidinol dehydrogenase [Clostridium novyi A str. GD211209]KEH91509.1 histidinol dehydrogenase [Clostridium botulinum C/D str. It1]